MVPSAVKNTQYLADWAKRKQWENNVVLVKYYEDAIDKIEHVQFRVKFNKGEGSTNVIIHTNYELSWHNVIQCNCGWTLMSGRPCIHAAFCLRFPNLDNKLPKDKYFAQYSCDRKSFYHRAYHVDRMIAQYSVDIVIPELNFLTPETVFPPRFLSQAGNTCCAYQRIRNI